VNLVLHPLFLFLAVPFQSFLDLRRNSSPRPPHGGRHEPSFERAVSPSQKITPPCPRLKFDIYLFPRRAQKTASSANLNNMKDDKSSWSGVTMRFLDCCAPALHPVVLSPLTPTHRNSFVSFPFGRCPSLPLIDHHNDKKSAPFPSFSARIAHFTDHFLLRVPQLFHKSVKVRVFCIRA